MENFVMRDETVVVIPARMSGQRLPGKPMIDILGKPMIQHVYERCSSVVPADCVFVATEDDVIVDFCRNHEMNVVKTDSAPTAIDRIFLFSKQVVAKNYLTVLGDEPIINVKDISRVLEYAHDHPDRVVFGKCPATAEEFVDVSKAKVVCDIEGKLLYSSRAGIPVDKQGQFVRAERAIWIYSFPRSSLARYFNGRDSGKLEALESNEILRFLEIGEPVYCVDLIGDSWAVDESKDLEIVRKRLLKEKL
jgi:3-deoxy-manno-octulosonate cytidylyltransferase (CMP-KDO synthetase)